MKESPLLAHCHLFTNPGRLADPTSQVVQLGTTHPAQSLDLDLLDPGRMEREGSLDPLTGDDSPHREGGATAGVLTADDGPVEDLNPLLVTLDNSHVHIDGVADMKLGEIF